MSRITFIVLHLGFGGVEKAIANQANILCQRHDVEIISAYKLYDQPPFYIDPAVKITYLMTDLKPNPEEFKAAVRSLNPIRIFREAMTSVRVLRRRVSLMRRAIANCHTDVLVSSRILYNDLLRYRPDPDTITISQEHRHHDNDAKYISKLCRSVEDLDYFMPVSAELTQFYQEQLADKHVKCVYIPHNIDSWPQEVSPLSAQSVVSVGRLSVEKGYVDLIRAFALFHETHPLWDLHIIGDGDQRSMVEQEISNFGLDSCVKLHGYQNKDVVNDVLHASSIYAMASHSESFGIVLIEAQSHGLPCVAYDSARGALEIISDGKDGFLVPDRDPNKFAECLSRLADDSALRQSMGVAGRENSRTYSQDNVARQLFDFYDSILR